MTRPGPRPTPANPSPNLSALAALRAQVRGLRDRGGRRSVSLIIVTSVLVAACGGGSGAEPAAQPHADTKAPAEHRQGHGHEPVGAPEGDTVTARGKTTGPQGRVPQFKVECGYSHSNHDDPIVHPGRPGRAHRHDFFGSTATDAHSTPASLLGTDTTCQNRKDTAAYWAPALLRDGEPVEPTTGVAYYRPGAGVDPTTVAPFPEGLVIIAGDQTATAPQDLDVAAWHCGASPVLHSDPPECPRTAPLGVRLVFPDCWDGERLDSDDHQSHMAYGSGGECPASHPSPVPQLIFEVHYPVWGDPAGLELASGGVRSLHADFVQAWDQKALEREVRTCLNREKVCGVVSNRATG